jgi:hypothetical protein
MTELEIISAHEAGHVIAAYLLGLRVRSARADGESPCVHTSYPGELPPVLKTKMLLRSVVADLAGGFAERFLIGTLDKTGSEMDERNAWDKALRVADGHCAEAAEMIVGARHKAQGIVLGGQFLIRRVARALAERGSLTGPEVEALIEGESSNLNC